jgi:hypothetical protein
MNVKVVFTVEASDELREAIRWRYGLEGLAYRNEVRDRAEEAARAHLTSLQLEYRIAKQSWEGRSK